ncbi:MAG: UDP-3-O-(3-hydroxymyristoyl)glucosamine N-acyltransferase [Deltaproteobacteria bacterium]|nr:UDP-3-O-(3-hydroxymyristoyl)glucosamine N-acyltransferase [Deltaproteobacteria bacterium]
MKLKDLADKIKGRVRGNGDTEISRVMGAEAAGEGDITFISNPKYTRFLGETNASAVIVTEELADAGVDKNFLIAEDPYLAFAKVLSILNPKEAPEAGISKSATIADSAKIGSNVHIGANVVIEDNASIGDNSSIYANTYIGKNSTLGSQCLIYPNVTIRENIEIKDRVSIHSGTVVGSDGFGYAKEGSGAFKVPQTGGVIIEDDVELGASVTIDRGTIGETIIGAGSKIDNLVQIAHNVKIGKCCIIVAQVGISGSTTIGDGVTIAGQSGIAGHLDIADNVTFGARSGVTNDVKEPGVFTGYPAMDHKKWLRVQSVYAKLPELSKRIKKLEMELEELRDTDKKKK